MRVPCIWGGMASFWRHFHLAHLVWSNLMFPAFCWEPVGGMAWNLACWCVLNTSINDAILVMVCWFFWFFASYWHRETGHILGFQALSGERVGVNVRGERRHISDALRRVLFSYIIIFIIFYISLTFWQRLTKDAGTHSVLNVPTVRIVMRISVWWVLKNWRENALVSDLCVTNETTAPCAPYQIRKIAGCACAGNAGNVFPATDFNGNR